MENSGRLRCLWGWSPAASGWEPEVGKAAGKSPNALSVKRYTAGLSLFWWISTASHQSSAVHILSVSGVYFSYSDSLGMVQPPEERTNKQQQRASDSESEKDSKGLL